MKKQILSTMLLLALLLTVYPNASVRAQASQNNDTNARHISQRYAHANFYYVSDDQCVVADILVLAVDSLSTGSNGKANTTSVVLYVSGENICTGEWLWDSYQTVDTDSSNFQLDGQYRNAHLSAIVPIQSYADGDMIDVLIDLTWSGVENSEQSQSQSQYKIGSCQYVFAFRGVVRSAHAYGTINIQGHNVASNTSTYADIGALSNNFIVANCSN